MKNWRCKHVVLGTYEIENVSPSYTREVSADFAYIDTSICYNNDYFLGDTILRNNDHIKIISKIPPQMVGQYEFMMHHHLRCLGRDKIDIMLIHNPRSEWVGLAKLMIDDLRIKEVGVSNFSIEDLEKYKSEIGVYPSYNEIEINPDYYDKSLIEFCHDNDIKIIAYAILGGKYNARRNISQYTLPYLLTLAGLNAEYVIVRSDSYSRVASMKEYLDKCNKVMNINEKLFNLDQTNNKSIIPNEYKYPKFYTRLVFPTNSDKIVLSKDAVIARGFEDSYDVRDDLDLHLHVFSDINYEFISDYRVLIRYNIDQALKDETGKYPDLYSYPFPSMYVAGYRKGFIDKLLRRRYPFVISSVNILMKDGNLSKVNNGEGKFIVESIKEYK